MRRHARVPWWRRLWRRLSVRRQAKQPGAESPAEYPVYGQTARRHYVDLHRDLDPYGDMTRLDLSRVRPYISRPKETER